MSNDFYVSVCEPVRHLCIDGKRFEKETVKAALAAHCKFDKPYIFKAGNVARSGDGSIRIIVGEYPPGKLRSVFLSGLPTCSHCQANFESRDYVKIGELKDYLPKDE